MIFNPNKSIISTISTIIIIISVVWSGSIKALHSFLHCQPSQQCNQLMLRIIRNVIFRLEKKQKFQCKIIINHIDLWWYLDASCFNLILLHSIRNVVCIKHMMCSVNCSQNSVSVKEKGCVETTLWAQMNTHHYCSQHGAKLRCCCSAGSGFRWIPDLSALLGLALWHAEFCDLSPRCL